VVKAARQTGGHYQMLVFSASYGRETDGGVALVKLGFQF